MYLKKSDARIVVIIIFLRLPVRTSATALLPQIVLAQYFAFNYVTVKDQY